MSPAKSRAAGPKPVPPLTSPRRPRKPSSSERTLDNGLRVVVVRKRDVPLVEVRLRVPFLSAKPKHSARATLLSDTVLSGTDRYDRGDLAAAVQALGGDLSASVDADRFQPLHLRRGFDAAFAHDGVIVGDLVDQFSGGVEVDGESV